MDWSQADLLVEGLERLIRNYKLETQGIYRKAEARAEPIPDSARQELEALFSLVERMGTRAVRQVRAISKAAEHRDQWCEARLIQKDQQLEELLSTVASATLADGFNPHGCFVYCLWGKQEDRPLYVGQSTNVLARLGDHVATPGRGASIRRITLIRCADESQMNVTEARLISHYRPPDNIKGIQEATERTRKWARTPRGAALAMSEVFREELKEEERLRLEDETYLWRLEDEDYLRSGGPLGAFQARDRSSNDSSSQPSTS